VYVYHGHTDGSRPSPWPWLGPWQARPRTLGATRTRQDDERRRTECAVLVAAGRPPPAAAPRTTRDGDVSEQRAAQARSAGW
jgi:hypothetical protein